MAARRADRSGLPGDGGEREIERNGAPDPLSHATPDAELAEAQLAAGREDPAGEPFDDIDTPEEEAELEQLATGDGGGDDGSGAGRPVRAGDSGGRRRRGELATTPAAQPARKAPARARLMTFLRGSWAELQRVQWPDRRQVMQATGVVIGFVIVAGVYLGAADWAAGKIMDFILK